VEKSFFGSLFSFFFRQAAAGGLAEIKSFISSLHSIRSTPRTHNQHIHREYYARVYDDEKHRATLPKDDKNSEEDYQGKGCLC
jgi:hypothetical protein